MKRLVIIHNLPIDYYPPAFNLLKVAVDEGIEVTVITTKSQIGYDVSRHGDAKILYPVKERRGGNAFFNLIRQIYFVIYAFLVLIKIHPDVVLYYESSSAFAPYLYRKLRGKKVSICAHYHEYTRIEDYKLPGMRIQRIARNLEERYLLHKCQWVSHTNTYRLNAFRKDYPFLTNAQCHVLPNYPPSSWKVSTKRHNGTPIKCVLIGSLSIKGTFIREFTNWVLAQNGNVIVDLYSYNFHAEIIDFFQRINSTYVKLHSAGIPYHAIPSILTAYDVGLILYKPYSLNVVYCETNKFYEYLSCGLDVWFPSTMKLLNEMDKSVFAPNIQSFDVNSNRFPVVDEQPRIVENSQFDFFCEPVYANFLQSVGL